MKSSTLKTLFIRDNLFAGMITGKFEDYLDDPDFTKVSMQSNNLHKTAVIKAIAQDGKVETTVVVGLSAKQLHMTMEPVPKQDRNAVIILLREKKVTQDHIAAFLEVSQSLVSKIIKEKG